MPTPRPSLDLFCRVIDNYGDIGVCWRLARQLSHEHSVNVRLFVDDLISFAAIEPRVHPELAQQRVADIEILQWLEAEHATPAQVVIEAFACEPSQRYVEAMAQQTPAPIWINLEYLSAESWVDGVHGLPSPHPRLPLKKYFFCPGFTAESGGLIREIDAGHTVSPARNTDSIRLFAFTYPHAPLRAFADALSERHTLEVTIASTLQDSKHDWQRAARVPQTEFDNLLAPHDVLVVRGEDSFIRAQWLAKPFIWHIYPTDDEAHLSKLDAWLDRYCEGSHQDAAQALRQASHAFNRGLSESNHYQAFVQQLGHLASHAEQWRKQLMLQDDLATRLLRFINAQHQ